MREPISPPSAAETQAGCLDAAPGKPPSLPVPTRPWPVPGPLLRQPGCRPATPPAWLSWETGATSDVMRELTLETPAGGGDAGACSRHPGEGGSQRETQPGSQPVSPGAPGAGPKETPGCSPKSLAQEPALPTYTCVCTRCPDPDLVLESLHDKQDGDPGRGPQWRPERRSGNPSQAQAPRAPAVWRVPPPAGTEAPFPGRRGSVGFYTRHSCGSGTNRPAKSHCLVSLAGLGSAAGVQTSAPPQTSSSEQTGGLGLCLEKTAAARPLTLLCSAGEVSLTPAFHRQHSRPAIQRPPPALFPHQASQARSCVCVEVNRTGAGDTSVPYQSTGSSPGCSSSYHAPG